mmetsp:Transcript_21702/g.71859  ORF Transcript_21702/g.71859 Transcript_21702/m.71859 type:complete len:272 (+) Transcript_21702:38-853(+)
MLRDDARQRSLGVRLADTQVLVRHAEAAQRRRLPRLPVGAGRTFEEARVAEQRRGRHDGVSPRLAHARLRVSPRAHVPVREDRDAQRALDCGDGVPVRTPFMVPLLAPSAVHRHRRDARPLQQPRKGDRLRQRREDPHLRGDRHAQAGDERLDELLGARRVVHQVRAVSAEERAPLRAAKIEVDRVASLLNQLRRGEHLRRVAPSDLHDERPVVRVCREPRRLRVGPSRHRVLRVRSVGLAREKIRSRQHRRVAQSGPVPANEHAECELTL